MTSCAGNWSTIYNTERLSELSFLQIDGQTVTIETGNYSNITSFWILLILWDREVSSHADMSKANKIIRIERIQESLDYFCHTYVKMKEDPRYLSESVL